MRRILMHTPPAGKPDGPDPSRLRIEQAPALDAFKGYVESINLGRFTEAARHMRALRRHGLHILWQPRRAGGRG